MGSPSTKLKCSLGHTWEPSASRAAPLVCPTCGRPPAAGARGGAADPEQTVDQDLERTVAQDMDRTVDLPTPTGSLSARTGASTGASSVPARAAAPDRGEVTESMHFTPLPRPPGGSTQASSAATARPSSMQSGLPLDPRNAAMPFTILRQHARGGLGLVNLARDEHIKREVALKQILPQHVDNGTLKKRFLYEAQITGQLEHPSIVPVYTLGSDEIGNPYYVMRFVKGRTLDEIIKEHHTSPNPIVFRELLRRFYAVCQAVAYAHSRGIIHRDLKPSNIMLGDYGETLVLDWGLAKDIKNKTDPAFLVDGPPAGASLGGQRPARSLAGPVPVAELSSVTRTGANYSAEASSAELTMAGQIIGTPAYMAPEQAEGRTELHGAVTDIYALGGILYKILSGQSPTAPTASVTAPPNQRKLTFVESPPPSKVNQDVDPELEKICLRAMATVPAARYPRALELAQDVQRWLDEHPLTFKRPSGMDKLLAAVRKFGWLIAIALLAVVGVLLMILIRAK